LTGESSRDVLRAVIHRLTGSPAWLWRRRLRLAGRRLIDWFDPLAIAWYRLRHGNPGPIPPVVNRRRVGNGPIQRFLDAGDNCYRPIKAAVESRVQRPLADLKILDFGAGCGRTLIHFVRDNPAIYATDVDESAVRFLARHYRAVRATRNEFDPSLPYPDGFFDVVYSVSVFTHLSPASQQAWLQELHRVLKPGGLALLTTQGYTALHVVPQWVPAWEHLSEADLREKGALYLEDPQRETDPANYAGISRSYGITFFTPEYVRAEWGRLFQVEEIQDGVIDHLQDLVVLRKRPDTEPSRAS